VALSLDRKLQVGFGSAILLVILIGAVSYLTTQKLVETNHAVEHSQHALAGLQTTLSLMKDIETGERGYIITGDARFLEPHNSAAAQLRMSLDDLQLLTANNPAQQERLSGLRGAIAEKLRFDDEALQTRETQGLEAAARIVSTGRGKALMDDIRRRVAEMTHEEESVLYARTQDAERRALHARFAEAILALLAVLLGSSAYGLVRRDSWKRDRAEGALREANTSLEKWTSELETRTRQVTLLSEMGSMLQSCLTAEEAHRIVAEYALRLFPSEVGALCILAPSRNMVETVAVWGSGVERDRVFTRDDCWALRSGRPHCVEDPNSATFCRHVEPNPALCYLCVPLMAQGDALGILHLRSLPEGETLPKEDHERLKAAKMQLATTVAEHIALALANLRLSATLRMQSIRDPLTGLFNRRYMEESMDREIRRATRNQRELGAILLDIDHFKRYNDAFGHEAGDALLRELGAFLQTQIRGEDIACRYGGEEFTLILPEASLEITQRRAEQMRQGVKKLKIQHKGELLGTITLSLGVAALRAHGTTAAEILRAADAALYRAKELGRDRVEVGESVVGKQDSPDVQPAA
jgi:diguanylate cyclase (GGDEF)-like protein